MKINLLEKTKTYLVGHMQYSEGRDWREYVEQELEQLNVTVFNPNNLVYILQISSAATLVTEYGFKQSVVISSCKGGSFINP